jgi:hypothetical protein
VDFTRSPVSRDPAALRLTKWRQSIEDRPRIIPFRAVHYFHEFSTPHDGDGARTLVDEERAVLPQRIRFADDGSDGNGGVRIFVLRVLLLRLLIVIVDGLSRVRHLCGEHGTNPSGEVGYEIARRHLDVVDIDDSVRHGAPYDDRQVGISCLEVVNLAIFGRHRAVTVMRQLRSGTKGALLGLRQIVVPGLIVRDRRARCNRKRRPNGRADDFGVPSRGSERR